MQSVNMVLRRVFLKVLIAALFVFVCVPARAAGVVIKIRAINPLEEETVASIRYPLPKEVTPNDVVAQRMRSNRRPVAVEGEAPQDMAPPVQETDLKFRYDKENKYYFVDHKITLAPKEIVTFELEVNDVWAIPLEEMEGLRQEMGALVEKYPDLDETALSLQQGIGEALTQIEASQADDTVAKVGVENHIKAHEKNAERLRQARMDVKMLKNLLRQAQKPKKPRK